MRVIVSHFYNEEYLLPWWLSHHSKMFDHGVLINNHSTDRSVEICRQMVPTWDIVTSENTRFEAILCDFEVMKHEARFPGAWKIALTTTEFIKSANLEALESYAVANGATAVRLAGAIMADGDPSHAPVQSCSLLDQKNRGVWESEFDFFSADITALTGPTRSRLYHCYQIGAYTPGRHGSHLPGQIAAPRELAAILWYAYSPWTALFKQRKLQIKATQSPHDIAFGWGAQHGDSLDRLEANRLKVCRYSQELYPVAPIVRR